MSLSRELSRGSVVMSQKICRAGRNGGGLAAMTLYDDFYGGPPEFAPHSLSPRPEDYSEIFGSFYVSRASSIPILDLPPADETDVFFDVRSSSFDYAEVFGGLFHQDFAVTYEELTEQSNERNGDSPEEARTPAPLSDNSNDSTRTRCVFNRDSNLSCDGRTEISVSYHKTYQSRKEDMSNGKVTHVTQLSKVPEVTYLVDGTNSPELDNETQTLHANDDGYFNIDLSMGHMEGKQTKKAIPQPPNARQNFENDPQTPKGSNKSSSHLNRSFVTISEISLRTEPSQVPPPFRPPPVIGAKKTHHYRSNSNCNHVVPEGILCDSSPPFFDVEVDSSSSAAASAEAMKDVMDKAPSKLLNAKELIERKKEGVGTYNKLHLRCDMKDKEGSAWMLDQSNNGDNEIKLSVTDKMKIVTGEENQVSLRGEKLSMVANKSAESKLRDYTDDPREWTEEAGFFEVKPDHSRKAFELVKNGDIMIHLSGRTVKMEQDTVIEALGQVGGNGKKIETVLDDHFDKKQREKVGGEINWQEAEKMRSQTDTVLNCQTEYELSKVTICHYDLGETEKKNKITQPSVEKKGISGADKSVNYEGLVEVKYKYNKGEAEQTKSQVNDERKSKVIGERKDNENKIKKSCRVRENVLGKTEGIKHLEMKEKHEGPYEKTKGEKGLKNFARHNENGRRAEETLEHLVTKKRLQDDLPKIDDVKPPKETNDILDGKEPKEDEENGKKDIHERWENILITRGKHSEKKESEKEPEEVKDKESSKMGIMEAVDHGKIEVSIDNVGNECRRMFEDLDQGESAILNGLHVGTESCQKSKKMKSTERAEVQMAMGLNKLRTGVSEVDNEYKAMKQHCKRDQSREKVEATQGCLGYKESGYKISECKINNVQLDGAGKMHLDIDENVNVCRGEKEFKHLECQVGTDNINGSLFVDVNGSTREMELSNETKYCNREEDKGAPMASKLKPSSNGCEFEVLGDNLIMTKEAKSPAMDERVNQVEMGISTGRQYYVKVKNMSKLVSFPQYQDSKSDQERGEQVKALNLELNKDKFVPTEVGKERIVKGCNWETNAKPTSEREEKNQNLASESNAGHSTVRKDGEKNTERGKRDQELESDRLRKMEEEREREREREKDRMIVDRTTLEGRKPDIVAHAEKAAMERAIAEAQQRAMSEARERLEKACAEAREKSLAGKAVLEARVRAERAAFERANVEARERAFEKAVSEKFVFESRQRIERSFSDKLSASSRNSVRQSSSFSNTPDIRSQSTLESIGSRHTHSSANGEIREGIKGESAQRCKARLERHRRIAERAAKALAEKNMRDLLAQREQVEKSRLAETLDADVRRWSSGKERNLRALLSTLQYILWPDSGWQPIPLTEVITTAAVKKAYRKATLCVHPDKLQQRGASIQQKYICEKVFDLLKEAWNKFCSEEQ